MPELLAVTLLLGVLGLLLVVVSKGWRRVAGFIPGRTVALDDVTLFSERLNLVGRPDRIVRQGEHLIPEEWKSAQKISHGHRLQVVTYCLLIEEKHGKRPPFGVVVLGDGSRVRVENTDALRSEVLAIAEKIRERRRIIGEEIRLRQVAWKCRVCGHRGNCGQARA